MCRLRTTGRKSVLTVCGKHTQPMCLFVCLLVCYRAKGARPWQLQSGSRATSVPWVQSAVHSHVGDTSQLTIAALNQYFPPISHWIVPLAGVQEWTSAHWGEGGKMFEWIDGRDPSRFFSRFTTIRNTFSAISLNQLAGLLTENTVTVPLRQAYENNYSWLCLTVRIRFLRCHIIITFTVDACNHSPLCSTVTLLYCTGGKIV